MSDRTLNGSIALTKLPQSIILEKQGKSGIIRGVFLPIDGNSLTEKDGADEILFFGNWNSGKVK